MTWILLAANVVLLAAIAVACRRAINEAAEPQARYERKPVVYNAKRLRAL